MEQDTSAVLFVGTQGAGRGQGIVAARLDEASGELVQLGVTEAERPTWVLCDPGGPILYATSEVGNAGDRDGAVLGFAIEEGGLRLLSRVGSGGGGATHLALDADGRTLFVANFGGGSVAAIPAGPGGTLAPACSVQATAGSGPHRRQGGPHPHGVTLDPSGRWLLVPDMGADRVFVYRYDPRQRRLDPADPAGVGLPAGSGPRLLLFGADGRFAYLLTELSAELYVFAWDAAAGLLQPIASVALDGPTAQPAPSAAALAMAADGSVLYASNRATGEIQVYAIDRPTGTLTEVQRIDAGGAKPWAAALSPGGRWLVVANQGSDAVQVFGVDPGTGTLTRARGALAVPVPTGLAFAGSVDAKTIGDIS